MNICFKKRLICLLIIIVSSSVIAQSTLSCREVINDNIIRKTEEYIKSKVGDKFFSANFNLDSSKSYYREFRQVDNQLPCKERLKSPHFVIVYHLNDSDKEVDPLLIEFYTDTSGIMISECNTSSLPDCPEQNCWDYFPNISKDSAFSIAETAGLKDGIKEWSVSLEYFNNEIVWQIKNYLVFNDEDLSSGELLYINTKNGLIMERSGWAAIP